jgi:hypothetical protein
VRGECGRFLLFVLMNEEKEFLQTGLLPFGDSPNSIIEARAIGLGLVRAYPAYECRGGHQTHVHQVATGHL